MDFVVTTTELAEWAKSKNIDLNQLEDGEFDKFLGKASGAGAIFANTGGVMEAAIRTAYSYITGKKASELVLNFESVRGLDEIKTATININGLDLKLAVAYGLKNARTIIERIKSGEHFDFVEIMSCPGGCIGGGGQPKQIGREVEAQKARIKSIYQKDEKLVTRTSHENEEIKMLYQDFLTKPASELAEKLLHTGYFNKSNDLKGE